MGQNLNRFALQCNYPNIHTVNSTRQVVVPEDAEFVGLWMGIPRGSAAPSQAITVSIYNGATDTGADITVPTTISAAGESEFLRPDAKVYLQAGDLLTLDSDGGGTDSDTRISFVFERISAGSVSNAYFWGNFNNVHTAGNQQQVAVPVSGQFVGAYIGVHKGSAAASTEITFNVFKDNTDTGEDLTLATSVAAGSTTFQRPASQLFVEAGDLLTIESVGGGTDCDVTITVVIDAS